MKNLCLAMALMLMVGQAYAQSNSQYSTTEVISSPFEAASKILRSASDVSKEIFKATGLIQGRGVAGQEQLKDELLALNADMVNGMVRSIDDIKQPALRELFAEIAEDEVKMAEISSLVTSGSSLHRIATVVALELILN